MKLNLIKTIYLLMNLNVELIKDGGLIWFVLYSS